MVCPITSTKREYPLHVPANSGDRISGYIMTEQVRTVDYTSRNADFIEKASVEVLNEVLSRLYACF
jgi:mRNA interferase MazF